MLPSSTSWPPCLSSIGSSSDVPIRVVPKHALGPLRQALVKQTPWQVWCCQETRALHLTATRWHLPSGPRPTCTLCWQRQPRRRAVNGVQLRALLLLLWVVPTTSGA